MHLGSAVLRKGLGGDYRQMFAREDFVLCVTETWVPPLE